MIILIYIMKIDLWGKGFLLVSYFFCSMYHITCPILFLLKYQKKLKSVKLTLKGSLYQISWLDLMRKYFDETKKK